MTDGLGRAAAMLLTAMAIFGLVDNAVPLIAEDAGLWQFHVVRAALALILLGAAARVAGKILRPLRPGAVAARSLLMAGAMVLYFGALGYLPITEAAAGLFTSPIFVLIISSAIYRIPLGPRRIAAVALGFAGILLILKPGSGGMSAASLVPVAAGAVYAASVIVTNRFCAQENPMTLLLAFFLTIGAASAVGLLLVTFTPIGGEGFVLRPATAPTARFWVLTGIQAVTSVLAVGLLIRSYQIAEPSYLAPFEYTMMLFAGFFAWLLRGEIPGIASLSGMLLIVSAGVIIALRRRSSA